MTEEIFRPSAVVSHPSFSSVVSSGPGQKVAENAERRTRFLLIHFHFSLNLRKNRNELS